MSSEEAKGDPLKEEYKSDKYVEDNFPFCACTHPLFKCPWWVKCLLFEKYNISNVTKVIGELTKLANYKAKLNELLV